MRVVYLPFNPSALPFLQLAYFSEASDRASKQRVVMKRVASEEQVLYLACPYHISPDYVQPREVS